MPLAPQITNTPSTIVVNTDFTVTSVANVQETTTFYQATAPDANAIGDIWFDTANGNKQYRWDGSSWTAVQDTAIATAQTTANNALTSANGKNKVFYQATAPTASAVGDLWFDTTSTNRPNQWNGTSWVPFGLGYLAVTSIDASTITVNKITASQITSGIFVSTGGAATDINNNTTTINGGKITTGTITASQIQSGIFISSGGAATDINNNTTTINGGKITTGTITATQISSGYVYAGTINASQINANTGTFTGGIVATSGYIGSSTNGWQFSASGYLYNNTNTTILYPSSATNAYALITDRSISTGGVQSSGDILTTGSAKVTGQGTSGSRCEFTYYNTISLHSITAGYGVDSDWAPNSDNTYTIGQSGRKWKTIYSNTGTINTSDSRLKTDVTNSALGLDFIKSLRPVSYKWIEGEKINELDKDGNPIELSIDENGKPIFKMISVPGKRTHWGFIAQEVKAAVDASGVDDFAGWTLDNVNDPNSFQGLRYEQFIAPLTKAIQELAAKVEQLEGK